VRRDKVVLRGVQRLKNFIEEGRCLARGGKRNWGGRVASREKKNRSFSQEKGKETLTSEKLPKKERTGDSAGGGEGGCRKPHGKFRARKEEKGGREKRRGGGRRGIRGRQKRKKGKSLNLLKCLDAGGKKSLLSGRECT